MRFVGRKTELNELNKLKKLSKKKLFVIAVYGLRRVGKTRLLLEFLNNKGIYFFINKNKSSKTLLNEFQKILKKHLILNEFESINSWDEFFEILIKRNTLPVVFDEFQNFKSVEPTIFGIMQKNIDLNENKPGIWFISGSLIGLIKNLFKNNKEPLFGRIKKGIKLEPLTLHSCLELKTELNLSKKEIIKLYCIFGGYPKYFVSIEDFNLKGKKTEEILDFLFFSNNAPLEEEITGILSQEFGARSGTYYSILEAISNGNNTISLIASALNTNSTSITRQIKELKDYFELIEFELPFEGKRGIYKIKHPLINFWFSKIHKNYSNYIARKPEFIKKLKENLNQTYSTNFEKISKEFLIKKLELIEAKRQWGKIQNAEKGKNTYEIDLIAKNNKKTFAFEFKWKELTNKKAETTLKELQNKIQFMQKKPKNITFGLIAKKIQGKQKLRKKGFKAFDLNDF